MEPNRNFNVCQLTCEGVAKGQDASVDVGLKDVVLNAPDGLRNLRGRRNSQPIITKLYTGRETERGRRKKEKGRNRENDKEKKR